MELSGVGKHCEVTNCKQLDFLPFKCDGCQKVFCAEHRKYESHKCGTPKVKDKVVPTCPLCSKPVSVKDGEDINKVIDSHITAGCKDERQERIFTNQCTMKGCKKAELVPITCKQCKNKFCLQVRDYNATVSDFIVASSTTWSQMFSSSSRQDCFHWSFQSAHQSEIKAVHNTV